jgi:hypothetical protein
MTKKHIFYISLVETPINNGIIQAQAIRVLKTAVASGHDATLFSSPSKKLYSRHTPEEIKAFKHELQSHGINFLCVPLPVITNACIRAILVPFFILFELPIALYFSLKSKATILHCRSYPASLIGILIKAVTGKKIIFDMRGVYPEEGNFLFKNWQKKSINYKLWKRVEATLIKYSDVVVVVSNTFKEYINLNFDRKDSIVIHCAPEIKTPTPIKIREKNIKLVYSGTIDGWTTPELLAETYARILIDHPEIEFFLNIYTTTPARIITPSFSKAGIAEKSYAIKKLAARDVFFELCKNDIGLLVRVDSIVNEVSFPVKFGEYLLSNNPVIISGNLLGVRNFLEENKVGAVLENKGEVKKLFANIDDYTLNCQPACNKLNNALQYYIDIYKNL